MTKDMDTFFEVEGATDAAPATVEAPGAAPASADGAGAAGGSGGAAGAAGGGAGGGDAGKAPAGAGEGAGGGKPPATAADAPAAASAQADEPAEDIPEDQRGLRAALLSERGKRNDWKGQAERALGELAATKAALEEARKAPPAAAPAAAAPATAPAAGAAPAADPPAAVGVPNPLEDPQGYHLYRERQAFNDRLNLSEMIFRKDKDPKDVDAKVEAFKKAAADNPQLRAELVRQVHPYEWVYEQGARVLALSEIGTDPAAYRARVEAEIRASLATENGGGASVRQTPVVTLPRSLANAPSSAPRMTVVAEAPSFESIFDRRRRA